MWFTMMLSYCCLFLCFLGAAAGSPYIVFKLTFSYGFMLRIYIYIYIYIYIPPVQVTVATTTCASRVSALVGHRKRPPVQVTVAPGQHMHAPFAPPHVPESECAQWLKKKTTSASYSRAVPAPPPLECTLQQANVSLPKGMPLN